MFHRVSEVHHLIAMVLPVCYCINLLILFSFIFSLNNEDLTPLDIAIMSNHVPMAKMLIAHGGRENPKCEY